MRLDKYLSSSGYGTRSQVKDLIRRGFVRVNGEMVRKEGTNINENSDAVTVDGEVVRYQEYVYLMLHKPSGYLSANEDSRHPTVFDLIEEYRHRDLFCVGRLDLDTEGLLLICDHGDLAHRLLSPRYHVPKQYEVTLAHDITNEEMERVADGIVLEDGYQCKKAKIWRMQSNQVLLEITEGKFHQVKRMFQQVGNEVTYLKRISMGPLKLDPNLPLGAYRELTDEEVAELVKITG